MSTTIDLSPIPQPPTRLILGNVPQLRKKDTPIQSMVALANEYGPLYRLQLPMGSMLVASGPDIVAELCDPDRFDKGLGPSLLTVRKRLGDGLFTAYTWEPNWQKAHRIMMPPFSQESMNDYLGGMLDIANQLMSYLDKLGPEAEVNVAEVMTNLTLDTIALCGFSYRFDSFSRSEPDPFVEAMVTVLTEQQALAGRPPVLNKLMLGARRRTQKASSVMNETVDRIIEERRRADDFGARNDLLHHLLTGIDKKTGEGLPHENIRAQCLTFLIAGHETTSGLLSFAVYYLLKHPEILSRACQEVDQVLGTGPSSQVDRDQLRSLEYIEQILKETLRLWPTAPAFSRTPYEDTVVGERFALAKGEPVTVLLPALHRAPEVWGDKPDRFDPDRFLPEPEKRRPPHSFLPFGTGARACIGRQFALQEAKLVLAMLLHRFELVDHTNYQLRVGQSLTLKPANLKIKLKRRSSPRAAVTSCDEERQDSPIITTKILFGSNLGAGESLAHQLERKFEQRGLPVEVRSLDEARGRLPDNGVVLVICSSYNGRPPDNAGAFCDWLENAAENSLTGLKFAVFGCGNREWTNTYQEVPRYLNQRFEELGGARILSLGEGDAGRDLESDFHAWADDLWESLSQHLDLDSGENVPETIGPSLEVETLEEFHPNPFAELYGATPMVIVENRELQNSPLSGRSTRHIELALPEGTEYSAGDHLGIIPQNGPNLVRRVAARFGLTPESRIRLHQRVKSRSILPLGQILSVGVVLTHYVELQEVASRRHLEILSRYAESVVEARQLEALARDRERYLAEIQDRSKSLLDLLEQFSSVRLPFGYYLELVPPLKTRYYSISSSPQASGRILSITVGVVRGPARRGQGTFEGCCSSYLAGLERGQTVLAFLQESHGTFRLAPPSIPIIMIGAGTGLAPYRGFLQERAALKASGTDSAEALLIFGCRHRDQDFLYREELQGYEQRGLMEMATAFSRDKEDRKLYVQDRLRTLAQRVWKLLESGAVLYVCGDAGGMAAGVRTALADIIQEQANVSREEADDRLRALAAEGRYRLDVWATD